MIQYIRTDSDNVDFRSLITELDAFLAQIDGKDHLFYAALNKIDFIPQVIVAYDQQIPVACGAIRPFDEGVMEVKRMYVKPEWRGKGVAMEILRQLEKWVADSGLRHIVLETGRNQPAAIAFYRKCGYHQIPSWGVYRDAPNSVCFEKHLS